MPDIVITELEKNYQSSQVLNIPSLIIGKGEIIGLVGNNGAGKTTLFRLILDLIPASSGNITINGTNVKESEHWKNLLSAYLDQSFLLDFLKPEEYFYFIGERYQLSKANINERLHQFEHFFNNEILGQRKKFIRDLSSGNKQKIGIAGVFLTKPEVIILDEPFNALDPTSQVVLKKLILDYQQTNNCIIIISSHDLNHITDICNRILLLEKGHLLKDLTVNHNTLNELQEYFNNNLLENPIK
ncbi:MAG: ABC transporter ATP-binding protein [Cytophagales bacterium]|nr:MAG: ABC transporter ATP-binding protein [Cytophagales bacterium]